ncbi:MAG: CoA transferase [Acetobacteraceae bacterium]|nr:CoA transferase [Acetobacteraceae bacterium]
MDYHSAFKGLKVVDLTGGVAGPSAAMMFAQHGADVIKVETPHGGGDWSRILGKTYEDHSSFSLFGTLGKRCVALDLKTDEGKEALWKFIDGADVFMEGFRPGTIQRYGFGYDAVKARNPGIIYYSISGFGQTGPMAGRPAMDPVLQAFNGIVTENRGEMDNHPHRIAISLIDMYTGLLGFQAIATSLFVKKMQNLTEGRYIECSLMQGGAMLSVIRLIAGYLEGDVLQRGIMPAGVFDTADGQINVTMIRNTDWAPFCEAMELQHLQNDPRWAEPLTRRKNMDDLYLQIRPVFKSKPTAWIAERLTARNIMNGRVNSYSEFLKEEQVLATNIIAWLQQPGVPQLVPMPNIPGLPAFESGTKRAHAPHLGEHTREVLRDHGYSDAEIDGMAARKVIKA